MKKIVAFILCTVIALGLFAFVACDKPETPDVPGNPSDYKTVDLTNAEAKQEFIDTLSSKLDVEKLVGDINSSAWSFGLKSEGSSVIDLNAKFTMVNEGVTSTFDILANIDVSQQSKLKLTADADNYLMPFAIKSASSATSKGKVSIPDYIYNNVLELDEDTTNFIKGMIGDFNWTVKSYVDNNYTYIEIPQKLVEAIQDYTGEQLPSNKWKIPLEGLAYGGLYAIDSGDIQAEAKLYLEQLMEYLVKYKVSVAVSTKDGYAIKISATKDTVLAILQSEELGISQEVLSVISEMALINTFNFDIYLAVDENGAFKQASMGLNIDLAINVEADEANGIPGIEASLKMNIVSNIYRFDGNVTLPNLSDYVDITQM